MNGKRFQKRKESFICKNCATFVEGDGFTNHCPECFCSKHVDIFPGDRLEKCGGLMKLVDVEKKGEKYILFQKCQKCHYKNKDKFRENRDNFDALIRLIKNNFMLQ